MSGGLATRGGAGNNDKTGQASYYKRLPVYTRKSNQTKQILSLPCLFNAVHDILDSLNPTLIKHPMAII